MTNRAGGDGAGRGARAAVGGGELKPRLVPSREPVKRIKGDVPESVAGDFEEYCAFVVETTVLEERDAPGEILAAALREFFRGDKSFPVWKARRLEAVSSDEVERAVESLGASTPQAPRPAERAARSAAEAPPPPAPRPASQTSAAK